MTRTFFEKMTEAKNAELKRRQFLNILPKAKCELDRAEEIVHDTLKNLGRSRNWPLNDIFINRRKERQQKQEKAANSVRTAEYEPTVENLLRATILTFEAFEEHREFKLPIVFRHQDYQHGNCYGCYGERYVYSDGKDFETTSRRLDPSRLLNKAREVYLAMSNPIIGFEIVITTDSCYRENFGMRIVSEAYKDKTRTRNYWASSLDW